MKKLILPLLALLLVIINSCIKSGRCSENEMSLHKKDQTALSLRTDGFYYGSPGTDYKGEVVYSILVFYRNSVCLEDGRDLKDSLEQNVRSTVISDLALKSKSSWGAFDVTDSLIRYEHWVPATGCSLVQIRTGKIIDSVSFVFTHQVTKQAFKDASISINDTFRFHKFDIKPDSTNDYVK